MTGGTHYIPQSYKRLCIFSADITPKMLKLCRVTKVKVIFLVLVYVFNFDLFEFSAAILEKGLLIGAFLSKSREVCMYKTSFRYAGGELSVKKKLLVM